MNNLPTLILGIPAYNEEANIKNLLSSVFAQKHEGFILEKIIVVSDASTDSTAALVRSFSDPRIELVEFKNRQGVIAAQNEIVSRTNTDILVLLDADVIPTSENFLEEIIKPILTDSTVGLVGGDTITALSRNFFEGVVSFSHDFKSSMYKSMRDGNNLYLCHGRARAFSKSLYKQILWREPYAEDAFSYLFSVQNGYDFVFAPKAQILFRSPSSLMDYVKQSRRFLDGATLMEQCFSPEFVRQEYHIPVSVVARAAIVYFFKNPLKFIGYLLIFCYARFVSNYKPTKKSFFDISESTKKVLK